MAYQTLEEIAKELKLSPSTISRVINGKNNVSLRTKKKVEEILAKHEYVPNLIARGLKTSTNFIGVIFPDINNPYFTEIISGIESILKVEGFTPLYLNTNNKLSEEESCIRKLLSVRVQGIILLSNLSAVDSKVMELARKNTILISVENNINGIDNIRIDNKKGTLMALEYLFSKGHKEIGYCCKALNYSSWIKRFETYHEFMKDKNILNDDYIYIGDDFLKKLDKNRLPTAIFTNNDMNALEIYKWCEKNKIRIPDDISVVGFDNISTGKILSPKLTTIAQPAFEMGQIAAENLLLRINNLGRTSVQNISIEPTFKERESVIQVK